LSFGRRSINARRIASAPNSPRSLCFRNERRRSNTAALEAIVRPIRRGAAASRTIAEVHAVEAPGLWARATQASTVA